MYYLINYLSKWLVTEQVWQINFLFTLIFIKLADAAAWVIKSSNH